MATPIIARGGTGGKGGEGETRVARGIALFRKHGDEIERTTAGTYRVPSASGEDFYLVYLEAESCSCPDHGRAKAAGEACKHRTAAEIASAKARALRARTVAA